MNIVTIKSKEGIEIEVVIPTKEDIDNIAVGTFAPDCFGSFREVVKVAYDGINVNGKKFISYYTKLSDTGSVSNSLTEGKILRSLAATRYFTSAELDQIEKSNQ